MARMRSFSFKEIFDAKAVTVSVVTAALMSVPSIFIGNAVSASKVQSIEKKQEDMPTREEVKSLKERFDSLESLIKENREDARQDLESLKRDERTEFDRIYKALLGRN